MSGETIHRLWTVPAVAALVVIVVAAVRRIRRSRMMRRRMASLMDAERVRADRRVRLGRWTGSHRVALREWWPSAAAGLTGFVLVGGVPGGVVGLGAAYGIRRYRRRRPSKAADRGNTDTVLAHLPLAADLLAACLAAGAGPHAAAEAVGNSLGGPVGERLTQTAAELRLGAEPADAWGRLGTLPGARALALCLERAQATGAPAVEPMARLAAQCRAEQARSATARARRAGVLATAPLGLCFLPAFLTVGVAPVLIGLAARLLSGG